MLARITYSITALNTISGGTLMMSTNYDDIDPFQWSMSSIGNAYFSGISLEQLWSAVSISQNQMELDAAIDAIIRINDIVATTHIDQ